MTTPELPPSLSQVPGKSDAELEQERILQRLERLISGLTARTNHESDPLAAARHLYENFRIAGAAAKEKHKSGQASLTRIAKEMKNIASGSKTLLRRIKKVDTNVFNAWAGAAEEDAKYGINTPVQKWLHLKALLQETAIRATRASQTTEAVAKVCSEAKTKAAKGRPEDLVAVDITLVAANVYEEWTGKIAFRSISRDDGSPVGEFHNFLTEVFGLFGISGSPDYSNYRLQKELAKLRSR